MYIDKIGPNSYSSSPLAAPQRIEAERRGTIGADAVVFDDRQKSRQESNDRNQLERETTDSGAEPPKENSPVIAAEANAAPAEAHKIDIAV